MFIADITKKLNQYFYYWERRSDTQAVYFQKINPLKKFIKYRKTSKLDPERLFLFKQDGSEFKHSETVLFSRQYRLELYFYKKYGLKTYELIHSYLKTQLLYDFMKCIDSTSRILKQLNVPSDLEKIILDGLLSYKQSIKKNKTQVRFYYVSKEPDSVNVINQILKKYKVRRVNSEYIVNIGPNQTIQGIKQDLIELFEKYKNGSTQYKLIL